MKKGREPPMPTDQEHPFEKVFVQIEEILQKLNEHKNRRLGTPPEWVVNELLNIEQGMIRFQASVERRFPVFGEYNDKNIKQILAVIPEKQRNKTIEIIERAQNLKDQTLSIRKDYQMTPLPEEDAEKPDRQSPIALAGQNKDGADQEKAREDQAALRKKFGRIGGRKNWRPM